jgi:hypothetical protein
VKAANPGDESSTQAVSRAQPPKTWKNWECNSTQQIATGCGIYIESATGGVVSFAGRLRENTEQHTNNGSGRGIGEDTGTQLQYSFAVPQGI